jgi:hypothetical protein
MFAPELECSPLSQFRPYVYLTHNVDGLNNKTALKHVSIEIYITFAVLNVITFPVCVVLLPKYCVVLT